MFKKSVSRNFAANPFNSLKKKMRVGGQESQYFSLNALNDKRTERLPYSIRVLVESAMRNCDNFSITEANVESILNWEENYSKQVEIPFKPARVLLQDFTGVPAVVDLAAMRDTMQRLGGDPKKINPLCPVDLVIDHSIQVDDSRGPEALAQNEKIEFERNYERFEFLKWGQNAFENFSIVPPGSGIVHQVNLEYLARVVMNRDGLLYPDSVVGTDSHTTMINGLGVVGWGVGGIEAEAVMLDQAISMVLPEVIGFKLIGKLQNHVTATDLVLTVVQMLRQRGVVEKFVEFFGDGCDNLSLSDRATISNMAPEYGATIGYFPVDERTMDYLRLSGRPNERLTMIQDYLTDNGLFRTYDGSMVDPVFSGPVLELDLASVEPCLSGPKRPHDRVSLANMKKDFNECLTNPVGFKGFGIGEENLKKTSTFTYKGEEYTLKNGSVVIAAITSCTNTSNPGVMIAAGLVAKNASARGLKVKPYIKTSLSPGSGVVTMYFEQSGVQKYLEEQGFYTAGYGCMTCIGNSGDLDPEVHDAIEKYDLVAGAVLSGNRNFEGRVHPMTRANYLASPPLVVAYALAGDLDFDFETQPIGQDQAGVDVFLKEIWPSSEEVNKIIEEVIHPKMFIDVYKKINDGTPSWNEMPVSDAITYPWNDSSTYIHHPPFFGSIGAELTAKLDIEGAYCLLNLGDSITTDHISPAGKIAIKSPAGRYLKDRGVEPKHFNSYGARRGNDEVMARGTFANIRGSLMLGVRTVIAQSFERIHRSNLVGMGVLPMTFLDGENADSLGLTGTEQFNIPLHGGDLSVNQTMKITTNCGKSFDAKLRLDTPIEIEYYRNGGILHYVLNNMRKANA